MNPLLRKITCLLAGLAISFTSHAITINNDSSDFIKYYIGRVNACAPAITFRLEKGQSITRDDPFLPPRVCVKAKTNKPKPGVVFDVKNRGCVVSVRDVTVFGKKVGVSVNKVSGCNF